MAKKDEALDPKVIRDAYDTFEDQQTSIDNIFKADIPAFSKEKADGEAFAKKILNGLTEAATQADEAAANSPSEARKEEYRNIPNEVVDESLLDIALNKQSDPTGEQATDPTVPPEPKYNEARRKKMSKTWIGLGVKTYLEGKRMVVNEGMNIYASFYSARRHRDTLMEKMLKSGLNQTEQQHLADLTKFLDEHRDSQMALKNEIGITNDVRDLLKTYMEDFIEDKDIRFENPVTGAIGIILVDTFLTASGVYLATQNFQRFHGKGVITQT